MKTNFYVQFTYMQKLKLDRDVAKEKSHQTQILNLLIQVSPF